MNDLQRQLASLHEALRDARQLDADERAALEAVVDDIQRVLDSSADEVPGAEHGDALKSAAVRLEAGHPGLAGTIRSVLDALAKAGI
jgi:predicted component of type VI protein secretion system